MIALVQRQLAHTVRPTCGIILRRPTRIRPTLRDSRALPALKHFNIVLCHLGFSYRVKDDISVIDRAGASVKLSAKHRSAAVQAFSVQSTVYTSASLETSNFGIRPICLEMRLLPRIQFRSAWAGKKGTRRRLIRVKSGIRGKPTHKVSHLIVMTTRVGWVTNAE